MGHRWLCLFALVAAAPSYVGGDVSVTEVPVARQWAPCPQDENPEPQEGHLPVPKFSTCMLRCAAQAMLGIVRTKPSTSLKLNEGREGEDHEFCWMLHLRCQKGEKLTKAFVLLNLQQPPEGDQPPPFRLLLTAPPSLRQHVQARHGSRSARLLSGEACGMRFDVTESFRSAEGGQNAEMCVRAVCSAQDICSSLSSALRCPPFLATLWRSVPRPDG
ncbi:uncharacterized protein LOC129336465 [Eublepharis macularius]|uniref:Uncharacterized protein LOC129336465 n=1 Tax=Eublepharis macularius TaxID=481883 RepID=A0AA97JVX7_EUBMA|nr:uncharacterized protein LOC129336465 [Eublepharis macularius]